MFVLLLVIVAPQLLELVLTGRLPRCTAVATLQHFNIGVTSVSSAALRSPAIIVRRSEFRIAFTMKADKARHLDYVNAVVHSDRKPEDYLLSVLFY